MASSWPVRSSGASSIVVQAYSNTPRVLDKVNLMEIRAFVTSTAGGRVELMTVAEDCFQLLQTLAPAVVVQVQSLLGGELALQ